MCSLWIFMLPTTACEVSARLLLGEVVVWIPYPQRGLATADTEKIMDKSETENMLSAATVSSCMQPLFSSLIILPNVFTINYHNPLIYHIFNPYKFGLK